MTSQVIAQVKIVVTKHYSVNYLNIILFVMGIEEEYSVLSVWKIIPLPLTL